MCDFYRKTWYEVDLDNLASNAGRLREIHADKTLIAVVKADAYGHGAVKVVKRLRQEGIEFFAVSLLEEALELRAAFSDVTILMMGVLMPENLNLVAKHDIVFTLSDYKLFEAVKVFSGKLRFHLKFDSGMNRLGFKDINDFNLVYETFESNPSKHIEGVYSHLATSDGDEAYVNTQYKRFIKAINSLPNQPNIIHLSNTSAWLKHESIFDGFTHARVGIGLYGYTLESVDYGLTPIGTLKTIVSQIKTLAPGELLGYGITFQAESLTRIAILPIGYADGWIRKHKGHTVLIKGKPYPIVGNVCMDQLFVKIDDTVKLDDEVILMGPGKLDADVIAQHLKTISYEVLCSISNRVPRLYIEKEAKT